MRRLLYFVGITPDRVKTETSSAVKFTNGDGEIIEIKRAIKAIKMR